MRAREIDQPERAKPRSRERVHIGAYVDAEVRDDLLELARERDRSVSSILRRALQAELDRASQRQRED